MYNESGFGTGSSPYEYVVTPALAGVYPCDCVDAGILYMEIYQGRLRIFFLGRRIESQPYAGRKKPPYPCDGCDP